MISYPQFINPSDILTSFGITGLQAYHDSMGLFLLDSWCGPVVLHDGMDR